MFLAPDYEYRQSLELGPLFFAPILQDCRASRRLERQAQLLLGRDSAVDEIAVAADRFKDKLVGPSGHDPLDQVDVAVQQPAEARTVADLMAVGLWRVGTVEVTEDGLALLTSSARLTPLIPS